MRYHFHRISGGIILIVIGVLIWLSNFGVINIWWHRDWPVILILVGILALVKTILRSKA
jgi:hypothetical protein